MELSDIIEKALRKEEGLEGLVVCSIREVACTKLGDNFMSVVTTAEVEGRFPEGRVFRSSVFVKRLPDAAGGLIAHDLHVDTAFANEAHMYTRVLPLLGVDVATPHCYHAQDDVILLEDLKRAGFHGGDRSEGFDLRVSTQVIKALAEFHGASFRTKFTKKEEFTRLTNILKPVGFVLSSSKEMVEVSLRRAITQVLEVPDLQDVIPSLKSLLGRVSHTMSTLRVAGSIAVLSHGDFWINNLLVRDDPRDPVRIVDLQACTVCSPAVDVWTFLYTSVQPALRERHFQELLQVYCTSFVENLNSLETHRDQIPSADDLIKELISKELYGFLVATLYLPALDINENSMPDIHELGGITKEERMSDKFTDQFNNAVFKGRICDLVRVCKKRKVFAIRLANK